MRWADTFFSYGAAISMDDDEERQFPLKAMASILETRKNCSGL